MSLLRLLLSIIPVSPHPVRGDSPEGVITRIQDLVDSVRAEISVNLHFVEMLGFDLCMFHSGDNLATGTGREQGKSE